jgi:hypothetical protein
MPSSSWGCEDGIYVLKHVTHLVETSERKYCHVFLVTWLIIMGSGSDESIYWTLTSSNYKNFDTLKITVTTTHEIKSSMSVSHHLVMNLIWLTLHSWILSYCTAFWSLLLTTPFHDGLVSLTHSVPSTTDCTALKSLTSKSKLLYD